MEDTFIGRLYVRLCICIHTYVYVYTNIHICMYAEYTNYELFLIMENASPLVSHYTIYMYKYVQYIHNYLYIHLYRHTHMYVYAYVHRNTHKDIYDPYHCYRTSKLPFFISYSACKYMHCLD